MTEMRITEAEIAALVDRFYEKARQDRELGPVFAGAVHDWETHLATMRDFWSSVMLTSGRYKGNPFAAHLRHTLRPEFFATWLALFAEAADELVAPAIASELRMKSARIAESLKIGLFYRPSAKVVALPEELPTRP
ncbi:MAG: preprotein translocase subunit TatC [Rhodospirillales bacterium]|jgi:hemoglobin|nr:preprotein translocase subunit TatC [Rhodospirillales bacterium]